MPHKGKKSKRNRKRKCQSGGEKATTHENTSKRATPKNAETITTYFKHEEQQEIKIALKVKDLVSCTNSLILQFFTEKKNLSLPKSTKKRNYKVSIFLIFL